MKNKKRILVVEDEKNLCLLYREELKRAGYEVVATTNARRALDLIKKGNFDLIITDIRMPVKDGLELIADIMAIRKDIPVIINTAYQSYRYDFMSWAADAYLIKSTSLDELKAKIKELIG
ncbi:MAG: response regulator [Candidatus Aminicenantes bacterium]|nr:response regulator [Candidatus Aminicenantes bacterium]